MSTNHILAFSSVATYLLMVSENKPAVTIFITQPAWHSGRFALARDLRGKTKTSNGWVWLIVAFRTMSIQILFQAILNSPALQHLSLRWQSVLAEYQTDRHPFDCCQISLQSTCPATIVAMLSYYWSNISVLLSWTRASRFASLTWSLLKTRTSTKTTSYLIYFISSFTHW